MSWAAPPSPATLSEAPWPRITLDVGRLAPLLAPLAVAAVVRLANLSARPLGPDEAEWALAGWQLWRAGTLAPETSPLLPSLLSLLFGAFGSGDGLARLPSVLAGLALVATPLCWSARLGRATALSACWLLALSPLLVLSSRMVGGAPLALLALSWVVLAATRWTEGHDGRWLVGLGAALAAGLGASPLFVPWLLVVALAALLTWGWPAPPWWRVLARQWRLVAAGAALVVIGLDTRLLTVPFGLQAGLIDPFWRWPASVALDPEPRQLMLLLTVEAALLFASLAGATRWLRPKTEPFGAFLALWLALALLLALAQSDAPLAWLVHPLLPASLLGGSTLARAWRAGRFRPAYASLLLVLGAAVPLVYLALHGLAAARDGRPVALAQVLTAAAGLLVVALLFGGGLRRDDVRQAAVLGLGGIALILSVAFIGRLSFRSDQPPALPGQWAVPSLNEATAQALAWSREHPDEPLTLDQPAARWLAWPLRMVPRHVVEAGQPASWRLVDVDDATTPMSGTAGIKIPAGAAVGWRDSGGPLAWWRWLMTGRDWVVPRAYAIIAPRS